MEQEALVTRRVLVGTEGQPEDEQVLTALCEMFSRERVRLRIVHVVTVPLTAPLEAPAPEAEQHAHELLARARGIAERFGIPAETAVLRGREVGPSLVEDARRTMADALCVRFRSRPAPVGHFFVSATVSALMGSAPCPVLIVHIPHH